MLDMADISTDVLKEYMASLNVENRRRRKQKRARKNLFDFMDYCWHWPHPLKAGLHTRLVCERIDRAITDLEAGKSTFLVVLEPFRHGKSDKTSRYLPPFLMGRLKGREPSMILTGYGWDLVKQFSGTAMSIIGDEPYRELFPDIKMSNRVKGKGLWKVDYSQPCSFGDGFDWRESSGSVKVAGLTGPITGSGYDVGILDDYCKKRAMAESQNERDKDWVAFTNEFLSRRGPASITLVVCTPWHVDDVVGRIRKRMEDDPDFPRFEFMIFPATGAAWVNGERIEYPSGYLFLERYDEAWYKSQRAGLGGYCAAGMLDCNPQAPGGNKLNCDNIQFHESINRNSHDEGFPDDIRYVRVWDLASTDKELNKYDPDYTMGMLMGMRIAPKKAPEIWVKDVKYGQLAVGRRNKMIQNVALTDGPGVKCLIEEVGAYKDAVGTLAEILEGIVKVIGITVSGGCKEVRSDVLVPIFDAGNVHILVAPWNDIFFSHFKPFPSGEHDDGVDCMIAGHKYLYKEPAKGFCGISDKQVIDAA